MAPTSTTPNVFRGPHSQPTLSNTLPDTSPHPVQGSGKPTCWPLSCCFVREVQGSRFSVGCSMFALFRAEISPACFCALSCLFVAGLFPPSSCLQFSSPLFSCSAKPTSWPLLCCSGPSRLDLCFPLPRVGSLVVLIFRGCRFLSLIRVIRVIRAIRG